MKLAIRLLGTLLFVLLALDTNQVFAQSVQTITSRKLVTCPVPENIYSDSGTVVVIVRISKRGRITKTQIDRAKSTTENKALFNNALKAAAYARYNRIEKDTVETGQLKFKFKLK